jgi:hypothetical protein
VSATAERGEAGGSGSGGRVGQDANGFDETVRGQAGEAKHQRRPRAGRWQQRRGPLHGNPPLGGGLDDGMLVKVGRQLDVQLDPGRHAADRGTGQPPGQRVGEGVAAGSVAAPQPPQLPFVGAGGDQLGQGVLVDHW